MDYFSGQKVVATCNETTYGGIQLVKDNIYTVSKITDTDNCGCSVCGNKDIGIFTKETGDAMWCVCELRPIEDFGASILRNMKAVIEVKKVKPLETVKQFTA